mmetsp:Transcript_12323/g.38339  ORF Transcript_12323/g.38339 Transcript_12323/m.38339 type:complete len:265 (-) Transcript_12323:2618-3412(-)
MVARQPVAEVVQMPTGQELVQGHRLRRRRVLTVGVRDELVRHVDAAGEVQLAPEAVVPRARARSVRAQPAPRVHRRGAEHDDVEVPPAAALPEELGPGLGPERVGPQRHEVQQRVSIEDHERPRVLHASQRVTHGRIDEHGDAWNVHPGGLVDVARVRVVPEGEDDLPAVAALLLRLLRVRGEPPRRRELVGAELHAEVFEDRRDEDLGRLEAQGCAVFHGHDLGHTEQLQQLPRGLRGALSQVLWQDGGEGGTAAVGERAVDH